MIKENTLFEPKKEVIQNEVIGGKIMRKIKELMFLVEESEEGGYEAKACDYQFFRVKLIDRGWEII